jgi:hypothetical protein
LTTSFAAALVLAGCAWPDAPGPAAPPVGCSDVDGDGHGVGRDCAGPDCDDSNPDAWDEAQCSATCAIDPHSSACPCDSAASPEPEICYGGPAGTIGIGACRAGLHSCEVSGQWGPCQGQVLPTDEICDEVDEDCDGEIDDGVKSACGDCNFECEEDCLGEGCDAFDLDSATSLVPCGGDVASCLTLGTAPGTGTWTHVFEPCNYAFALWFAIRFQADVSAGATLSFDVRIAQPADLDAAVWVPLGVAPPEASPLDLSAVGEAGEGGSDLELRVTFTATGDARPSLRSVAVDHSCHYGDP